ncbi:hypothetical protein BDK51DRAFT_29182 [Blyttiomyces helicus]|uniref:Uncharacterized protein n=1 Tax=Blyttiomyces helicus TaxID=388810 RepID=A0A4P9WHH6_9FUNG|nr:hypothetical protein BDK51DRAFT_29182 [Blyttiomyces helicus]|eukprot:RKO90540.1 hypothetical protein BDK51DRAFT_29182 [Blyttiomyces helicus]
MTLWWAFFWPRLDTGDTLDPSFRVGIICAAICIGSVATVGLLVGKELTSSIMVKLSLATTSTSESSGVEVSSTNRTRSKNIGHEEANAKMPDCFRLLIVGNQGTLGGLEVSNFAVRRMTTPPVGSEGEADSLSKSDAVVVNITSDVQIESDNTEMTITFQKMQGTRRGGFYRLQLSSEDFQALCRFLEKRPNAGRGGGASGLNSLATGLISTPTETA